MLANLFRSSPFISLALFFLAFIPRLLDLDRFLTADEFLWVDRSRNFLAGLTNAAYRCTTVVEQWEFAQGLACTLRTGHPGVTTMWTGSFGLYLSWLARAARRTPLHEFVVGLSTNPLDPALIAPARIGTVIITASWVVAVYWLLRRLVGARIALLSALLLALSPFHVALSRVIHHDALSTTFMTLSALTALIYWGQQTNRSWLIASGVLGGLGFLSKSPALFLMPFIALLGLWFTIVHTRRNPDSSTGLLLRRLLTRTVPDGLLWFALSVATVFAVWPAMWVIPLETIETVFFIGTKYATGGHAKGNYFLGEISKDPGPLFYPVTWLYRTTPLVLVGSVLALLAWPVQRWLRPSPVSPPAVAPPGDGGRTQFFRYLPLMLFFILGFYLLMTIGEKKQDRYFLPAYPWFVIIAAGGWLTLLDGLPRLGAFFWRRRQWLYGGLLAVTVALNGYLMTLHYPYYFTYFNPLLGGPTAAEKVMTIGWGEGLDQAADFLNRQISPTQTRVASWYQSTFVPFYYGPTISYSKEKGKALAGDYVVFYVNQVQRQFPDDIFFEYFTRRFSPKQVITLHGIDYVWIYPSLGIDHYVADQVYGGIAALLAWQWNIGDTPLPPGQPVAFDLYWEYLGKRADEPFFVRLVDAQGRLWAEGQSQLVEGSRNPPPAAWREGEILHEQGLLNVPPGMPPGQYQVEIGFYTDAPAVKKGELLFELHPGDERVTVGHSNRPTFFLPQNSIRVQQSLGDSLMLLGAVTPQTPVAPETQLRLELFWQITQPLSADSHLHVGLVNGGTGEVQQAWFNLSLAELFEPEQTTWQPGDIIHTRWQLDLLEQVSPGDYYFELVLPEDTDRVLPVDAPVVVR